MATPAGSWKFHPENVAKDADVGAAWADLALDPERTARALAAARYPDLGRKEPFFPTTKIAVAKAKAGLATVGATLGAALATEVRRVFAETPTNVIKALDERNKEVEDALALLVGAHQPRPTAVGNKKASDYHRERGLAARYDPSVIDERHSAAPIVSSEVGYNDDGRINPKRRRFVFAMERP